MDDFILVARDQQAVVSQKNTLVKVFSSLGVPLEVSKLEGPTTCLTFLGIEVDTAAPVQRKAKQVKAAAKASHLPSKKIWKA